MGVVVEVTDGIARVQPHKHSACSSCGSSTVCFPDEKPAPIIEATLAGQDVKIGDLVELKRDEAPKIVAALLVFGIPVVTLIVGIIVGTNASGQDMQGGVAGGLAGLFLGMFIVRFVNRFAKASASLRPTIGQVIDSPAAST